MKVCRKTFLPQARFKPFYILCPAPNRTAVMKSLSCFDPFVSQVPQSRIIFVTKMTREEFDPFWVSSKPLILIST